MFMEIFTLYELLITQIRVYSRDFILYERKRTSHLRNFDNVALVITNAPRARE